MSAQGGVREITREMRLRRVNNGKHTSPTLIAWADRIDTAVSALIAERAALRFALRDIATNCRRGAHEHGMTPHGVSAIAAICDAALTTGESA